MTDSWYIVVDHTVCLNYLRGKCTGYNDGVLRTCSRENCVMCIIEKKDLLKENRSTD